MVNFIKKLLVVAGKNVILVVYDKKWRKQWNLQKE